MSRGITVSVRGQPLPTVERAAVTRDLSDISGSFQLDYLDVGRTTQALEGRAGSIAAVRENDPIEIAIDGEPVLRGHVDDVRLNIDGPRLAASISGRDVTGDLVDCSVNPQGPGEYRGQDLLAIATALCAPFEIAVTADADLGEPFNVVALEPAEPVMAALEKLARQRGVLITSNGIGGLLLTTAGTQRAPAPLSLPGNVLALDASLSAAGLYSDVWVKGSFRSYQRPAQATLGPNTVPAAPPATSGQASVAEAAAVLRYGHAIDPTVRRYRPRVWVSATQSGGSLAAQQSANPVEDTSGQSGVSASSYHGHRHRRSRRKAMPPRTDASPWTLQDQAEWRLRSMRAQSQRLGYVVAGFGVDGVLWRPNTLVAVRDAYGFLDGDYLIGGVTYLDGPDGPRTRILPVNPDAYDLTGDEDGSHNGRRRSAHLRASDASSRRFR